MNASWLGFVYDFLGRYGTKGGICLLLCILSSSGLMLASLSRERSLTKLLSCTSGVKAIKSHGDSAGLNKLQVLSVSRNIHVCKCSKTTYCS